MEKKSLTVKHDGYEVLIPYIEYVGKKDGPHLFISGGMHGDEINGICAVEKIIEWMDKVEIEKGLAGKITVLPILNPSAFAHMQRNVYEDDKDLNRSFGFEKPEGLAQQIAYDLTETVFKHCDFGIDIHDAGSRNANMPHLRIHIGEESGCTKEMAQLFGMEMIVEREGHENMLAVAIHKSLDKPVITVEIGGAQHVFKEYLKLAVQGVKNFLAAKKMYKGKVVLPEEQYYLKERFGVKIKAPAHIDFMVELGEFVHDDQKIGVLYYPQTQEHEDIVIKGCGYLFSRWMEAQVPADRTIYSILETEECHRNTPVGAQKLKKLDIAKIQM